jgi:hypothetical protein
MRPFLEVLSLKKKTNPGIILSCQVVTFKSGAETNGSYSEQEVAHKPSWTAAEIKERGLKLLKFLEKRWNVNLGSEKDKLDLLHIAFLNSDN